MITISIYSGKEDFYDELERLGLYYILNIKVYIGQNKEPLKLACLADCVPYYPHIVTENNHKEGYIRLTEKSWVDIEEKRYGHHTIHDIYRDNLRKQMECVQNDALQLNSTLKAP